MSVRYVCDICDKRVDEEPEYYKVTIESKQKQSYFSGSTLYLHYCHDCYWKIQGFIKFIKPSIKE